MYWEYDTRLGRRWNLDPVDQVSISNYAVLSNSPILKVDPLGDDDYVVNRKGKIEWNKKTDSETDRLVSVKNIGDEYSYNKEGGLKNNWMSIDKGILSEKASMKKTIEDENGNVTKYEGWYIPFNDKEDLANRTFQFLANNTDVEFTLLSSTDKNSKVNAALYTSHSEDEEIFGPRDAVSLSNAAWIKQIVGMHNHPHTSLEPGFNGRRSDADNDFFKLIRSKKPNSIFYIYEKGELHKQR